MAAESKKLDDKLQAMLENVIYQRYSPEAIRGALQSAYALGQQDFNAELLELLKDAAEELRLIRMKDTDAVYDPTLRTRIASAIRRER